LVIGSNSNQNAVAPDITIASVVINLPHAFLTVAREVKAKTFKPRLIRLGSESDVVTLVINPAFQSHIPSAAMHVVDSVRRELAAGRFDPRAPQR
jgi:basic membrane lipoprotein Med (substrate-binding protein (PBP1-ABC) superfamily)